MLVITPALRKHMVENFSVKAEATDDEVRKSITEAVMGGKLEPAKLAELSAVKASDAELKVKGMVDSAISAAMSPVLEAIKALTAATSATPAGSAPAGTKAADGVLTSAGAAGTPAAGSTDNPALKAFGAAGVAGAAAGGSTPDAAGWDEPVRVRVKGVLEQFNDTRTAATWDKSDRGHVKKNLGNGRLTAHMEHQAYEFDMPTERSKVVAGVWFKRQVLAALPQHTIQEHWKLKDFERDILKHIAHEGRFVGEFSDGFEYEGTKLTNDLHKKAVLDDSTSGGLEAVPIEFDSAVILTPLLNGELFPFVSITNVTRRRIEATKVGNPTMAWGTSEGTAISLFNTDAFISAFDNSIYPITGAIELGLDFLNDSPLSIGNIVVQRYGERFRQEMDNVIADGDGTSQPEGLFTASGVTVVSPAGGAGAVQTVGDYESLRFGVAKEFREEAGMRAMYIGTDTSYSRARGIKVGASDERRIFGIVDQEDYMLFQRRYAINGSLTNAQIGYACMNRYRMYRRQGLQVQTATQDWTLIRQNKMGIVVRARFGGALELAAAMTKITAGQA